MLRRTFIKTCAALSLCAALPAMAFTEGADFVALEKPIADWQGSIVKIWSYDCPFCYKYDAGVDPKVLPAAEKATGLPLRMIHLETKGKYGVRRSGGSHTLDGLYHYLTYSEMLIPSSNYWNIIHGLKAGEAIQDAEGNQIMRVLGKNMVWLLKMREQTKNTLAAPETETKIMTNFIR